MALIIQIILVTVILAAMVMILLSIGRLAQGTHFDDPQKTTKLKREIQEKSDVLTQNSAFDYLMAGRESGRSSSRGPSSRKL